MTTTVLLTATVVPHQGVQALTLTDPSLRLEQYCAALDTWANACAALGYRLCLVDNSTQVPEHWRARLEAAAPDATIAYFPDLAPHPNKGVGEARLLDSAHLSGLLDDAQRLVKCTGRLALANPGACFPPSASDAALQVLLNSRLTAADSRSFAASRDVWVTYLMRLEQRQVEHGLGFEQALARATLLAMSEGVALTRFPTLPRWVGYSGGHGTHYGSLAQRAKRLAHTTVREAAARAHWSI